LDFLIAMVKKLADSEFISKNNCSLYVEAAVELAAHTAAIGMRFYKHTKFPGYRNAIFIAEHGSWNRNPPSGYRVSVVKFNDNGKMEYSSFVDGWLTSPKTCKTHKDCGETAHCLSAVGVHFCSGWGRPSDVEVLPDGSLLISDETKNMIYRVTYNDEKSDTGLVYFGVVAILITVIVIFNIYYFIIRKDYEQVPLKEE